MSVDEITVVKDVQPVSAIDKISESFKGIGFGLLLIIAASVLLYWNEGRTVERAGVIAEAELVCVDLPNIDNVDASFNGKLVYAKGLAKTTDVLSDPEFGISTTAIGLNRNVQYYQWVEQKSTKRVKNAEGQEQEVTTYRYVKEWTSGPVSSGSFYHQQGHVNSVIMPAQLESDRWYAKDVSFGAYALPTYMISSISNSQNLNIELSDEQIAALNGRLTLPMQQPMQQPMNGMQGYQQGAMQQPMQQMQGYQQGAMQQPMQNMQGQPMQQMQGQPMQQMQGQPMQQMQGQPMQQMQGQPMQQMQGQPMQQPMQQMQPMLNTQGQMNLVHVQGNTIYLGQNQGMPQIGDIKIVYVKTPDTNISLVAQVNGNTFEPYIAANGGEFSELSSNQKSKVAMFKSAKDSNTMLCWILRIVALFLIVTGFKMVLAPLVAITDFIPILGSIIEAGVGIIATLFGVAWSSIIFAIAWIRFRPMLALTLIGVAIALVGFAFWKARSSKKKAIPAEEPSAPTTEA